MKIPASFVAGLMIASFASAQTTTGTLSLQLGFPQGNYQLAAPGTGVGFRVNIMHRPNPSVPISIGGELGYMIKGSDSRTMDLYFLGFYDRYRVTASNNIVSFAFKIRGDFVADPKALQVFVDASIGTNLFYSSVTAERADNFGNTGVADGHSTAAHWSFVIGPGIGVEIPIGRRKENGWLFRGSYLYGSRTQYYSDPAINGNGEVTFTRRESVTPMILFETGIRLGIFRRKS